MEPIFERSSKRRGPDACEYRYQLASSSLICTNNTSRVDVKNAVSDQFGNSEKIINIFGAPENCTKACVKILEIIQKHSEKERSDKENEGDLELRMRTPSQLVGRLIGKGGSCVKKIMEDTGCKINISK